MAQILLVDYDIASLKGLKMCFDLKNFPTISATNVSTALQLLDTEKFHWYVLTGIYQAVGQDWIYWLMNASLLFSKETLP